MDTIPKQTQRTKPEERAQALFADPENAALLQVPEADEISAEDLRERPARYPEPTEVEVRETVSRIWTEYVRRRSRRGA